MNGKEHAAGAAAFPSFFESDQDAVRSLQREEFDREILEKIFKDRDREDNRPAVGNASAGPPAVRSGSPGNSNGLRTILEALRIQIEESLERRRRFLDLNQKFSLLTRNEIRRSRDISERFSSLQRASESAAADFLASRRSQPPMESRPKARPDLASLEELGIPALEDLGPAPAANENGFQTEAGSEMPGLHESGIPAESDFKALFSALERCRKFESADDDRKISYFQNGRRMILDAESYIRDMMKILDNAKKIVQKGRQASSPKDQMFFKEKLVHCQNVLRLIVFRSLKMCEKEPGLLPSYSAQILNVGVLKRLLEKLAFDSWDEPGNFDRFEAVAAELRDAFYSKITPPNAYVKSVLEELGAERG